MNLLITKGAAAGAALSTTLRERAEVAASSQYRTDRWAIFIVVPLALIVVFGVLTAWWIACQQRGMYPAFDFPNWNTGGTFKAYCKA
ncbi:hypothetical protein [Sinomonas humi]|uniref:ABC transporter permease n=1 Tax=Sinomonas humi TaxID=1338436 RepID=A0A0B2AD29_9MICC|nr:hypothetical protein [Sinomonas humi]KHL01151.1 hypothetical protein LK10_17055 [Sinomonas humi]